MAYCPKEGQKIWVGLEKPRFKSQICLLVGVGFGTNDRTSLDIILPICKMGLKHSSLDYSDDERRLYLHSPSQKHPSPCGRSVVVVLTHSSFWT